MLIALGLAAILATGLASSASAASTKEAAATSVVSGNVAQSEATFSDTAAASGTTGTQMNASQNSSPGPSATTSDPSPCDTDDVFRPVYFEGSLSATSYKGSVKGRNGGGVPNENGIVWYAAVNDNGQTVIGKMKPLSSLDKATDTVSENAADEAEIRSNVYYVEIPKNFVRIRFAASEEDAEAGLPDYGQVTRTMDIRDDITDPCFFAAPKDPVVYDNGYLTGYWTEAGSIFDPESVSGNSMTPLVTGQLDTSGKTIYLNSTFYDYYTDYELTGHRPSTYPATADDAGSHRSYLRYREFNQALSDYYTGHSELAPIYMGHFQPEGAGESPFTGDVAKTLNLFGYSRADAFFAENNSLMALDGSDGHYADAARGLLPDDLSKMCSPFFNEAFLGGANSKDTVLGQAIPDVLFPFTEEDQLDIDGEPTGVREWTFDSSKTTLHMAVAGASSASPTAAASGVSSGVAGSSPASFASSSFGRLFLAKMRDEESDPDGTGCLWSTNIDSTGFADSAELSSRYGFFPFNDTSIDNNSYHYDFGFGTRIDIPFTCPDNGHIEMTDGSYVPQTFTFSGDDDVWVYIDGKLVLDMGGQHGRVSGCINFSEDFPFSYCYDTKTFAENHERTQVEVPAATVYVSGTKSDTAYPDDGGASFVTFDPSSLYTGTHTLTMYYLERGMWESNLSVAWSIVPEPVDVTTTAVTLPDTGSTSEAHDLSLRDTILAVFVLLIASTTVTTRFHRDKNNKWKRDYSVSNHPGVRALAKFADFIKSRKGGGKK